VIAPVRNVPWRADIGHATLGAEAGMRLLRWLLGLFRRRAPNPPDAEDRRRLDAAAADAARGAASGVTTGHGPSA
jgi:hypothetical protein